MYKITKREIINEHGTKTQNLKGRITLRGSDISSKGEQAARCISELGEAARSHQFKNASTIASSIKGYDKDEYEINATITSTVYDPNDLSRAKTAYRELEKKFDESMKSAGFRKSVPIAHWLLRKCQH
jgi:hypothetical protein